MRFTLRLARSACAPFRFFRDARKKILRVQWLGEQCEVVTILASSSKQIGSGRLSREQNDFAIRKIRLIVIASSIPLIPGRTTSVMSISGGINSAVSSALSPRTRQHLCSRCGSESPQACLQSRSRRRPLRPRVCKHGWCQCRGVFQRNSGKTLLYSRVVTSRSTLAKIDRYGLPLFDMRLSL